ncbi:inovirus Gp2 family protein [Cellvibrio sp. PSBB006]|uniref:inovirus Gp2 family protein n=1 Tax=Cellvibrio sp. PSBB006 TaxID=1987723 RepID=UPI0035152B42
MLRCRGGLVVEYLDRLYSVIQHSLQKRSRVLAVRVDLHFPHYYHPIEQEALSNQYLQSFVKALRHRLRQYRLSKQRVGQRVHDVEFDYVWAREVGDKNGRPHFHLLLLFNGHAFRGLGSFSTKHDSLYNRIGEAWADALGLHVAEGASYAPFPIKGQYSVNSGCREQLEELFLRTSYLTKIATKDFDGGFHVFGGSRV